MRSDGVGNLSVVLGISWGEVTAREGDRQWEKLWMLDVVCSSCVTWSVQEPPHFFKNRLTPESPKAWLALQGEPRSG